MGFYSSLKSICSHGLPQLALVTCAKSNLLSEAISKAIVSDIRPVSGKKSSSCNVYHLKWSFCDQGLSLTQMQGVFSPMGVPRRAWEEIIIIKAVHTDTQTCLLPYLKKWPQRNSHCIYNRRNLVCISKESHFGENYRIITHMLRSLAFNEADSILRI